ncbi:MAG: hypothetical protein ACMXYE_02410 [Candidatus Woesearchaeota archaeon]
MSLDEYLEEREKAKGIVNGLPVLLSDAYTTAIADLKKTDGSIDYDALKNEDTRLAVVDKYKSFFRSHFMERLPFKKKEGISDMDLDVLTNAYFGISPSDFGRYLERDQESFTILAFEKVRAKAIENVQGQYEVAPLQKLRLSDKDAVFSYLAENKANVPALDHIDSTKITKVEQLAGLIGFNEDNGVIPLKAIKDQPYYR